MATTSPRWTLLYAAYPLLPVSAESGGGAEQVLHLVERQVAALGHRTIVAACSGSQVAGDLLPVGPLAEADEAARQRGAILAAVARARVQLIHDHSGIFWREAGDAGVPVLATLHLPRYMYPQEVFERVPPNVRLVCVSAEQAAWFRGVHIAAIVENGIAVERFPFTEKKDDYVLWLGRICLEKGTHLAIEAAQRAGARLVVAGQVYPLAYHQRYFAECVAPRLHAGRVRLVLQPSFAGKLELLRRARAVLLPTLVDETSSLVAMEAMACGTPVLAFRRGALGDIVRHGETGFLLDTVDEMAAAIGRARDIAPAACRRHVERHYSAARMAGDYLRLYESVLGARERACFEVAETAAD